MQRNKKRRGVRAKLTQEQNGVTYAVIAKVFAKAFGVHKENIWRVLRALSGGVGQ